MRPSLLFIVLAISRAMPRRTGDHAQASQTAAEEMREVMLRHTASGACTEEQALAAFVCTPDVSALLGFPYGTSLVDIRTGAQMLGNMKEYFDGALSTNGTRYAGQRQVAEATSSAIFSPGLNTASVRRMSGISTDVLKKGGTLRKHNESTSSTLLASSIPVVHEHVYPLLEVHKWYHGSECSKVEFDKQTKRKYKRKLFELPNGTSISLDCEHRIRYCSKEELARLYMESEQHRRIMESDPSLKFSVKTAQECICTCINECKKLECICPICTGFRYKLQAWDKVRKVARKTEVCICPECVEGSKWFSASENSSAWRAASTCGKVSHSDLENPEDGMTPMLNQLRCSLLPKRMTSQRKRELGAADGASDWYPPYAGAPCSLCGWSAFAPASCSVEMSDAPCAWVELQKDKGPNGEAVYCEKTGTRRELLQLIKTEGREYNYHMWVNQWTTAQDKLRYETFDGQKAIYVNADYAAGYQMMQHDNPKCSHGTSCNQYVALVLHSPGKRPPGGGKRPVQCDVWRIFSQAKGDSAYHQLALADIIRHYKALVPGLVCVHVATDGQRSQFKGRKNLGAMAELPHLEVTPVQAQQIDCLCKQGERACGTFMRPGMEIEVIHDFKASHHASGPVDNYGKDPRRAMDQEVAAGDTSRYNYTHCFDWCAENLARPSAEKSHLGTFGANGEYIWRAYCKHGDENPRNFPQIPVVRNFQGLEGSNEIYHWRARHPYLPQIEALFVACYCTHCRSGNAVMCKYHSITHSLVAGGFPKYFLTHEIPAGGAGAAAADGDSD